MLNYITSGAFAKVQILVTALIWMFWKNFYSSNLNLLFMFINKLLEVSGSVIWYLCTYYISIQDQYAYFNTTFIEPIFLSSIEKFPSSEICCVCMLLWDFLYLSCLWNSRAVYSWILTSQIGQQITVTDDCIVHSTITV